MVDQPDVVIWMRPEHSALGRPAERSRAEITAAAVELADREGLDAVSMRRVAAALGTGAASLYRYVATRDDLLDLMLDSTGAEYDLPEPSGDWLADLVEVARQARHIMRRHRWLAAVLPSRAVLGPHGVDLLEHVLDVLAAHPAGATAKLEAFGMITALTAMAVQNERRGDSADRRSTVYLLHVAAEGEHPRIAALLANTPAPEGSADRFDDVIRRVLAGLLAEPSDSGTGAGPSAEGD